MAGETTRMDALPRSKGSGALRLVLRQLACMILLLHVVDASQRKEFRHDVDVGVEGGGGEKFQLHSHGQLLDFVDLDLLPQVKRVACSGDRLMLAMSEAAVAHGWREGQLIIGGPQWGCNVTGADIFIKIKQVVVTLEGRRDVSDVDLVTVYHVPAGPLDMLQEASIFFRYVPAGKVPHPHHVQSAKHHQRFRRDVYNIVSKVLNMVDWHANFTTVIPFDVTQDSDGVSVDEAQTLTLHKPWGQPGLNVTTGSKAASVKDDFVLLLNNLSGQHRVAFTFDLVIKNVDRTPKIVRYISQLEFDSEVSAEATVAFGRELGLTYNTTIQEFPSRELLRVPVARPPGLPPISLVVTTQSLMQASVQAYSAGPSALTTTFGGSGFVTMSQNYDPDQRTGSDVTARDWSVERREPKSLSTPYKTQVTFSVFQTMNFNTTISWHYRDVDLDLSPPAKLTYRPVVNIQSSTSDTSRCLTSDLSVDFHAATAPSSLTVKAFGLQLWDVPLQPSTSRNVRVLDATQTQVCAAKCEGPSERNVNLMMEASEGTVRRNDLSFGRLRAMAGHMAQFVAPAQGVTWCGSPGMPCFNCSTHALDTPTAETCASRLMTSRLVAAMTHLTRLVEAEWPTKQLLILRGWDEATSLNPSPSPSLFAVGRAAVVGLAPREHTPAPSPHPRPLEAETLKRLGQLAVCAGLDRVIPLGADGGLEVGVEKAGFKSTTGELGVYDAAEREDFLAAVVNMDVRGLYPLCTSAPYLPAGSHWPDSADKPEDVCGRPDRDLHRYNRKEMETLVQYQNDDASLTFEPEGEGSTWCGDPSRPCRTECDAPSSSPEPWDWCSSRMITPRATLRLRTLQKLLEKEDLNIAVYEAFSERRQASMSSLSAIFNEGRGVKLASQPPGNESRVASLAVCAGFDFVQHTDQGFVLAFVKTQHGYTAQSVDFLEVESKELAAPPESGIEEEGLLDVPKLVDGGYRPDTPLSEHITVRDIIPPNHRYFRMDELLLLCVELVMSDVPSKVEIVEGSGYRIRSENFVHNVDSRHPQEQWYFQLGQAVELRPVPEVTPSTLFSLAKSVIRKCSPLTQSRLRGLGVGCHDDRVYVDVRRLQDGKELEEVSVWDTGTTYCHQVRDLQIDLIAGGPVIDSDPSVTCVDRGLDKGLEFLSFQMGQYSLCSQYGEEWYGSRFAIALEVVERLQRDLTATAGHGRLPRYDIMPDVEACVMHRSGGCMGSGLLFDDKVRLCSRMVHKYLEKAAAPYPDLTNVTTFFNTDTADSTVAGEACRSGRVCVEHTVIFSLLLPVVTTRYFESDAVERELFSATDNPTPLLDIATQELAYRTSGLVTVYVEKLQDIHVMRSVLKVLLVHNKNVSLVHIQVVPEVDVNLVTSSLQRKVTAWAGVACPEHSRFAVAPFIVTKMEGERHKRSVDSSKARNSARADIYDWETKWLSTML